MYKNHFYTKTRLKQFQVELFRKSDSTILEIWLESFLSDRELEGIGGYMELTLASFR